MSVVQPQTVPMPARVQSSPCEFGQERAERFFAAMRACPDARDAELQKLLELLDRLSVRDCRAIADFGAGHGYATMRLLKLLKPDGVINAIDNSADMLEKLPIHRQVRPVVSNFDSLQFEDCSVDLAVTLASFHHIINKNRVLQEIRRILRPGGYFVVADVYDGTPVQRFFDDIVRSHCITGHDADFLNSEWVRMIARRANMECVSSSVEETPWKFQDNAESRFFFQNLFSLRLNLSEMDAVLRDTLGVPRVDGHGKLLIPWTLGYHALRKPANP